MNSGPRIIIRHDFGDYVASPKEVAVIERAPKRGDGQPDQRYSAGRVAANLIESIIRREVRREVAKVRRS